MGSDAHRQVIDLVIVAVTGLPSTDARVYEDPGDAVQGATFPSLIVEAEDIEAETLGESHDDEWVEHHYLGVRVTSVALDVTDRDQSSVEVKFAVLNAVLEGVIRRRFTGARFLTRSQGNRELVAVGNRFVFEYLIDNLVPDVIRT